MFKNSRLGNSRFGLPNTANLRFGNSRFGLPNIENSRVGLPNSENFRFGNSRFGLKINYLTFKSWRFKISLKIFKFKDLEIQDLIYQIFQF